MEITHASLACFIKMPNQILIFTFDIGLDPVDDLKKDNYLSREGHDLYIFLLFVIDTFPIMCVCLDE